MCGGIVGMWGRWMRGSYGRCAALWSVREVVRNGRSVRRGVVFSRDVSGLYGDSVLGGMCRSEHQPPALWDVWECVFVTEKMPRISVHLSDRITRLWGGWMCGCSTGSSALWGVWASLRGRPSVCGRSVCGVVSDVDRDGMFGGVCGYAIGSAALWGMWEGLCAGFGLS